MTVPTSAMEPVETQSLKKLSFKSLKRALDLFSPLHAHFPLPDPDRKKIRMSHKFNAKCGGIKSTSSQPLTHAKSGSSRSSPRRIWSFKYFSSSSLDGGLSEKSIAIVSASSSSERNFSTSAIMERIPSRWPLPVWHAPWKNYRVISGHLGWVRSIAFDPSNTWFCTGSADRTIKIWDVGTGRLKLTLTGHIEQVRGLAVSNKHTYMFSAGDDKQVKCWDLEQNKVIRSYHGHLSGVYCLALHPTIDVLLTGGRDSVCRLWDIRSKVQIDALSGHENTVCSVFTRPMDPQVITGSHDTTIRLWDLRYVKRTATLTHHKKSVRAMALHPTKNCFASASADNIKKFNLPEGEFMHNMLSQQKTIIDAMAVNEDGVMVTGGDNGSLWFWDWQSGHNFQQSQTIVQPGSLDSEAGIYACSYDVTGTRLVTCEADKTIMMWEEDGNATQETHPLHFKPPKDIRRF
ncbi:protein pleiotropic regulatory locus 1-like isoform X1 [Rhododendron vialii]|uniref:protein pleiotropic regulatory locus 1-like isoform X1 n=1 Tax=Rhododendron vialii TaxID=182163 RepID=UPI00265DD725|nr:protein pleiotropic regulatory locus 1-like isoform X1 [Rhododendron vialii]